MPVFGYWDAAVEQEIRARLEAQLEEADLRTGPQPGKAGAPCKQAASRNCRCLPAAA